jgi:hypothetical protein
MAPTFRSHRWSRWRTSGSLLGSKEHWNNTACALCKNTLLRMLISDPRLRESGRHRLNMELDLKSLFGLHVHSCTHWLRPWMKEAMDNTSRVGVCLRCPVFISVHFSLHDEGSSEYIRLCEGRESLSQNFQTFHDPRHQFHGISTLVSETLHPLATLALLHMIP